MRDKNYKNISSHNENYFIIQKSKSVKENPLNENSSITSDVSPIISFELNDDKSGIHEDDSNITLEN